MSKITRIAVLVISLVSLFGVLSSAAGAVTWTNTGQTRFTATAGAGTLTGGATNLTCSSADGAGTAPTSAAGAVADVAHFTLIFTGCSLAGQSATEHCTATVTALTFISPGMTYYDIDLLCTVYQLGQKTCQIEGSTPGTYTNGAAGVFALSHSSTLRVTNGAVACRLGNGVSGTLTPLSFRVTSGTGPIYARDA
jgi:hypothetical protein